MISVVIVSFNARDHLRTCLQRLTEAEHGIGEIIVADNASHDDSPEMVRQEFPHVRLLELGANLGFGTANNRAIRVSRGDHLLLLNSDAWPEAGCVQSLYEVLERRPKVGLVAPRLRYPDGQRQFNWCPTTSILGETLQKLRNPFEPLAASHHLRPWLGAGWYTAACLMLRRQAFEQVAGFDEKMFLYFEDVDLCLRLRQAGWRLAEASGAGAVHVKGGSQTAGETGETGEAGENLEYRRGQLYYYRKHRPAWELRYLVGRLRRKFERLDGAERQRFLALLEQAE